MDEELIGQETNMDDAIEAFMKSAPVDEDNVPLSNDEDGTTAEAEEIEAEETEDTADEEAEDSDTDPEGDDAEGEDDDAEEGTEEAKAPKVADDDAEVVLTVDGKEVRASVKDLKRLYGQEAALTQKGQALANQRKVVEAQSMYVAKVLQDRYEAAKAQADKYANVDLFRASRELDPEDFDALRSAKELAESEVKKLEQEGQTFMKQATETRNQMLREQAKTALKEITKAIPEWSDELYGKIRTYAVKQGMDPDIVNEVVDPGAIVLMHKAMKYDEALLSKPKVVEKVTKAPKKVLRSGEKTDSKSSKLNAKKRVAQTTGDVDDIAELFLAAHNS